MSSSVFRRLAPGLACLALASLPLRAGEIHVPADAPTIQAAVDLATKGDVIVLADGVYKGAGNRDVVVKERALTIRSASGAEHCIIDCEGLGRAFVIGQAGWNTVLEGLTIRRGRFDLFLVHPPGQALIVYGAAPVIRDCVFVENGYWYTGPDWGPAGGAVAVFGGSPRFEGCRFVDNKAEIGGAVYLEGARAVFERCQFIGNQATARISAGIPATHSTGQAGAIDARDCRELVVTNSLFANNTTVGDGGAIRFISSVPYDVDIVHCTFVGNRAYSDWFYGDGLGDALFVEDKFPGPTGSFSLTRSIVYDSADVPIQDWTNDQLHVTHCDVQFGFAGAGNFDADPQFVDAGGGDYRLLPTSPCLDRLPVDGSTFLLGTDLVGTPRALDGDLDGVVLVDVGAYERSNVHLQVTGSGNDLTASLTGLDGLVYSVLVGRAELGTPVLLPRLGLLLVDLLPGAPPLLGPGTIPDVVPLTLPPGLPPGTRLLLVPLAVHPSGGAGNLGATVELVVE